MSADVERPSGVEVLAVARSLNFAVVASTSVTAPVLHRVLALGGRSRPRAGEDEQVIGEHPESDPSLHPAGASVPAPTQTVTAFQCADPSFAACAPTQSCARRPRTRLPRLPRQDDIPDTAVLRRVLIAPGSEPSVRNRQLRSVFEERDVPIQGGRPERPLWLAALAHGVVSNELPLGLLDLHEPTELRRLGEFALSDDLGVRLEETDHLARKPCITAEDPGAGLRHHAPEQVNGRPELRRGRAVSRQCALGLAQDGAGDSHQLLVEPLHARLAPRAYLRAHPGAGRTAALRDLEDPASDGAGAIAYLLAERRSVRVSTRTPSASSVASVG
jgi:hypothetical protein